MRAVIVLRVSIVIGAVVMIMPMIAVTMIVTMIVTDVIVPGAHAPAAYRGEPDSDTVTWAGWAGGAGCPAGGFLRHTALLSRSLST